MRLVRHYDQEEREPDGAVYDKSKNSLTCIRAIQGHTLVGI